MDAKKITTPLLMRLPSYLNYLRSLPEHGPAAVSASAMAKELRLGDVLVRKDLAIVSGGGRRKVGHLRQNLIRDIEDILGCSNSTNAVLIGTGKLGQALLSYEHLEIYGIRVLAGFDTGIHTAAESDGKPVLPMEQLQSFCRTHRVHMGIITVPSHLAQQVCDRLLDYGITTIWNFAPVCLQVPDHVLVQNADLASSLAVLRMHQLQQDDSAAV